MGQQSKNNTLTFAIIGFAIYNLVSSKDELEPEKIAGNKVPDLVKKGKEQTKTDVCTLTKEKFDAMADLIEMWAESFRNQILNTAYTETLNVLKPLQTNCDVKALQQAFGRRWIGVTLPNMSLDETLNYIFGDGDDIGVVNNWFAKNRPLITYRF